jgi:hypothetical protein
MMWCCEGLDDVAVLKTGLPKRKEAPVLESTGTGRPQVVAVDRRHVNLRTMTVAEKAPKFRAFVASATGERVATGVSSSGDSR